MKELIKSFFKYFKKVQCMLKRFFNWLQDPLQVNVLIDKIGCHADEIQDSIRKNYEKTIDLSMRIERLDRLYEDYKFQILVSKAFEECTPDLYWAKDTAGRYVIANKAIRDCLLFDNYPYGKTDYELSIAQKARIGDRNHTFGEVCVNSDEIVLEQQRPMRFVEWGNVNGKMMILEVHKNVMRDEDDAIVGTVGIGRDITSDYNTLRVIAESTTCIDTKDQIFALLDKYTIHNKDHNEQH